MKCPECVKQGKKSVVTFGSTITNAGPYYPMRYDEDGKLMPRPSPTSKTYYTCSNNHAWSETS